MKDNLIKILTNERAVMGPAVTKERLARAEADLGCPLPPSYRRWFLAHGDGFELSAGNSLRLSSLEDTVAITKEVRGRSYCPLKDLIVFGGTGVDAELWAFYTGKTMSNGEYPVIWITPGSIDSNGYVWTNTNFDTFLNVWIRDLTLLNSNPFRFVLGDWFLRCLYLRYDTKRKIRSHDFYRTAATVDILRTQIDSFKIS